ncbi:MAG TPA: type II toxin-antitoxin system VapC family toxin [Rhizomicrobium sp.]|nr:type II toxin-antitoxin system VapC family toxin [Rhizomicrobium sp.]
MIVIDPSAILAVLLGEPHAAALVARIESERPGVRYLSAASYLEAGAVIAGRHLKAPVKGIEILDEFLSNLEIDIVPLDSEQARIGLRARIAYGRGFGAAAGLNFGDCFSYALAKSKSAPLLYVGNDFDKTDIVAALRRSKR